MKRFTYGLSVLVFALGLAGVPGCGVDNETDVNKPSADLKDPGPAPKPKIGATAPPTDMNEYIKKQQATSALPPADYPGADKKKK